MYTIARNCGSDVFSKAYFVLSSFLLIFAILMVGATNYACGLDPRFPLTAPILPIVQCVPSLFLAMIAHRAGKPRLTAAFAVMGIVPLLGLTAYVMSYEVHALPLPLADTALLAADKALGFDWDSYVAAIREYPLLDRVLIVLYNSISYQQVAAFLLLIVTRPIQETYRHLAYYNIAVVSGMIIAMGFPAIGMLEWADKTALVNAAFFETPHDIVMLMREHRTGEVSIANMVGMLTFPSFHALAACTAIYGFRNTPLRIPACLTNIPIFFSAIFHGAHYLADIIGGIGVFLIAVGLLRLFDWSMRRQVEIPQRAGYAQHGSRSVETQSA